MAKITTRPGNLLGKKLLVVCKPCNEGWMEDIERTARPILTPLLRGEAALLTPEAQRIIAIWCGLRAIICEKSDAPLAFISAEARKLLYGSNALHPWLWKIWIGHCTGAQWTGVRYSHLAAATLVSVTTQYGIAYTEKVYLQTSTFGVGKLYLHIFSSTYPIIYGLHNKYLSTMHQVFLGSNSDIKWPPACPINDVTADELAFSSLERAGGH